MNSAISGASGMYCGTSSARRTTGLASPASITGSTVSYGMMWTSASPVTTALVASCEPAKPVAISCGMPYASPSTADAT
jgi:hypothetical protein